MKIAISFGSYILFLIANIGGRVLLVNVGNTNVDDDYDGPRKQTPGNVGGADVDDPRKKKPIIVTCPKCCLDWSCKLPSCIDPKICPELLNPKKNPLNDASMEICPPCCPLCDHPFCVDPKICPKHAPELVKSKEVSAKIPEIIEQPEKNDGTKLTVKMSSCPKCCFTHSCRIPEQVFDHCINPKFCPELFPEIRPDPKKDRSRKDPNQERIQPMKCPECCSEGNCATGFYCNDPEICPGLANQERNQPNKDGEERRVDTDCKVFENPDNECRKNSFCICISRDGKRICPGYSNCKFGNLQEKWNCACQ